MNNKIKLSHSFFFIVFFSFLFGSCVKENLVIPTIEPTYKIEDITIEGVQLKKITGTINESLNLKNTYQYLLSGLVYVEDSLTIQEGTIFYADNNVLTSLIVNRSAMIFANGTAQQPIIFTSENEIRQTAQPGDWGGIHINGQASLNSRKSGLVELIGKYGRTDIDANDLDNSGQLKYVRIEYGGRIMNGESGSLNLNGVGSNTSIEHIQVYKSLTSGIRFRGGAANLKYAISTQPEGRGFRWDDGWRGFGQFWIVHFPESMSDTVTAIEGRSGIVTDLPISSPIISNITVVGLGINSFSPVIRGIRFREATHGKIYNSIITNSDNLKTAYDNAMEAMGSFFKSNHRELLTKPIKKQYRANKFLEISINMQFQKMYPDKFTESRKLEEMIDNQNHQIKVLQKQFNL